MAAPPICPAYWPKSHEHFVNFTVAAPGSKKSAAAEAAYGNDRNRRPPVKIQKLGLSKQKRGGFPTPPRYSFPSKSSTRTRKTFAK